MSKTTFVLAACVTVALLAKPAVASDASITSTLLRGVANVQSTRGDRMLYAQLADILTRLRSDRGSTTAGRSAKTLAVEGFTWTRKGLRARLDLMENDSGNLPAATRDARAADRRLKRGAALLRSAGNALGLSIGRLNGY